MTDDHEPDPLVTDPDPHIAATLSAVDEALDLLEQLAAARTANDFTDTDLHAAGLDDDAIAEIESGRETRRTSTSPRMRPQRVLPSPSAR